MCAVTGALPGDSHIIPHGVDDGFFQPSRVQRPIAQCSESDPLRILYVSIIDLYKHQWHVAAATAELRAAGLPVSLTLIGPAYGPAMRRLRRALRRCDPAGAFIHYVGPLGHEQLPARYAAADLCVFASSCENMPNILLEGMAAALPIACSNRSSMPELLGEAGTYFDPEDAATIAAAMRRLIDSPPLRLQQARAAAERAAQFSWAKCARATFEFLSAVAAKHSAVAV